MVYDNRMDKYGLVDLNLQSAWLKMMEDIHPEAWTEILLDTKEFLSKYKGTDSLPKFIASLHLTCAADALAGLEDKEAEAFLEIFRDYLQKQRAAHERNQR